MTTPLIQAKSSNIILIRSKETKYETLNSDFSFNLKNAIDINKGDEAHVTLISAEIPYSFYNISSDLENNFLIFDSFPYQIVFPNQDYNITELVKYFNDNSYFSALFSTTYNTQKNKITFTNVSGSTQTINFSLSTINKIIGFDENQTDITILAGESTESVNVCNLCTVHSIMVRSNLSDANTQSSRNGNSSILQKISIDVNSNFLIYLNNSDYRTSSIIQNSTIDFISMQLTNQDDKVLNLNGVNFEISLLIEIFPIDSKLSTRRILTAERDVGAVPTQSNMLQAPNPRLSFNGNNVDVVEDVDVDNTHAIENTSEIEHKSRRIILDSLLDKMSK